MDAVRLARAHEAAARPDAEALREFTVVSGKPVRVAWAEYPFDENGRGLDTSRLLLWEGQINDGVPYWSDQPFRPCVSETSLKSNRWLKTGGVLAFATGVFLVASDDQKLRTIPEGFLRVLKDGESA